MPTPAAKAFRIIGLPTAKRSIAMLVLAWVLSLAWLGINYFWRFATIEVLLAIPVLSLVYAAVSLIAYVYWGLREVHEQDAPYAGVLVGVIVAFTLLYFNFNLLQFVLEAVQH